MMNTVSPSNTPKGDTIAREKPQSRCSLTSKAKTSFLVALTLVTITTLVVLICSLMPVNEEKHDFWPSYKSDSKLGKYQKAAVSTDAAPCAPVGRDILQRNGSAVDAAIAVLVCMGANNPQSLGLGGGFHMMYYNRTEKKAYFIDSREVAPHKATADMFEGNATNASEGGLSIAVPGELAGYEEAHRKFGRLPWKELFAPTIKMCNEGIIVSHHLAKAIASSKKALLRYEAIRNVFLKNGTEAYDEGERIQLPKLAHTLEAISNQGMKALYGSNKLSEGFLGDLRAAGSIIDRIDMQSYKPRIRNPVQISLRKSRTLYSTSIPGSGAILAFMLNVIDGYPDVNKDVLKDQKMSTLFYHRMMETTKYAYSHRSELEDEDSPEMEKLLTNLSFRAYADKIRTLINDYVSSDDPSHYGTQVKYAEDHGTAHISLVSPDGDAVSVTSTINQYFGSKVMSPSTGIILNNQMNDFSSTNITNSYGLNPSANNRIRPGKRPITSSSPAIVVDDRGNVTLVIGGCGGTRIISSVFQVVARVLFFGEDIKKSIDAPRIHHQLMPNKLQYEKSFPQVIVENLRKAGHDPEEWDRGLMSVIMGVHRGEDGYLYANADYRKGGDVDGF